MSAKLHPLERPRALGAQVYDALREQLRSGTIDAGQLLQEVAIAGRLGVSRTPVREALMRLASEGLVASQGRSFSVPALGRQDVEDIYGMRNLLEPAAMRQVAARSADAALRAPVEAALAAARAACDDGDAAAFREANQRFRAAWLALVPNPRLVRAIEQYADHMVRIRRLTLGDSETRKRVLQGLERIAAALAAGNADAAEQAVRQHLAAARSAFLAAVGLED